MNCIYFACSKCGVYLEPGYRWAYWKLVDRGIVKRREKVSIDDVLACSDYWNPVDEEGHEIEWLKVNTLPKVQLFLQEHKEHGILFLDEDDIIEEESIRYNWKQIKTW